MRCALGRPLRVSYPHLISHAHLASRPSIASTQGYVEHKNPLLCPVFMRALAVFYRHVCKEVSSPLPNRRRPARLCKLPHRIEPVLLSAQDPFPNVIDARRKDWYRFVASPGPSLTQSISYATELNHLNQARANNTAA